LHAGQGALVNESFVDADGNGICDNYEVRVSLQDGTGMQMHRGGRWNR
jgi:hypothetical protein